MTIAQFTQPDFTLQSAAAYKAAIDAAIAVLARQAAGFAAHQQDVGSPAPDLSVRVDAGAIFSGTTLTEVAAQTVSGFTTPSAGQTRVDRVVVNTTTGVATRIAGTAVAGSPSATPPAITAGNQPCCRIAFTDADTVITNSMITDERVAGTGGGGLTKIQSQTASGSATIDFISGIDGTYDEYVVIVTNCNPASNDVTLNARVSVAGVFSSANYTYAGNNSDSSPANTAVGGTAQGQFVLTGPIGSTLACSGEFRIFGPSNASVPKNKTWHFGALTSTGVLTNTNGSGRYAGSSAAIDGLRFLMSAGNITSGTFTLYGVNK